MQKQLFHLKYLDNFSRTLEMLSINCEINFILTWLANCIIWGADRATIFCNNLYKALQNFC